MTPKMHEALLASIEHWKGNLAAGVHEAKIHGWDCPLCKATRQGPDSGPDCSKCPVMQKTGKWDCEGSPWYDVAYAYYDGNETAFPHAAQREITFLRSLLPENEAPDAQ